MIKIKLPKRRVAYILNDYEELAIRTCVTLIKSSCEVSKMFTESVEEEDLRTRARSIVDSLGYICESNLKRADLIESVLKI